MQTAAIIEAALQASDAGSVVYPEIMLPLISIPEEMRVLRERLETYIRQIFCPLSERSTFQDWDDARNTKSMFINKRISSAS